MNKRQTRKFEKIDSANPYGNQQKLLWHLGRIHEFMATGSTFPIQVELNPTNFCNMACRWCITEYCHQNEHLDLAVLQRFLEQFKQAGGKSVSWTGGGEPSAYKHIKEGIETAAALGLKQGMMTNGLYREDLAETLAKHMTWVRFSLDTVDPESYAAMKGVKPGALDQVLRNIENLTGISPRPRVVANINLAEWNSRHVKDTIAAARARGADGLQLRPILPTPGEEEELDAAFFTRYMDELAGLKDYEDEDFQLFVSYDKFNDIVRGQLGVRNYDKCQYHQFIVVLNANGDLCVCTHHLGDERFTFGNIYENSVREIWDGERRKSVIRYCDGELDFKECQLCCKGHELNKFLYFIQNPTPGSDPDFF